MGGLGGFPGPVLPVEVLSVYRLQERLEGGGRLYSHCLSIGDPGEAPPDLARGHFAGILRLEFHDICSFRDLPREEHPRAPRLADIRKILAWFEASQGKATGYTVHCHAGVHRSVAAAMMLLYLMSGSVDFVREEIVRIKAFPLPNHRMIELFDRETGAGLGILEEGFKGRLMGFLEGKVEVDPDDYLEELDPIEAD